MLVFISWSGEESRAVAQALHQWIPEIIQSVQPWMAPEDIGAGQYFAEVLANRLEQADYGIICLTRENLHSPWVLFEGGALAKATSQKAACPFLIGLEPSLLQPPWNNLHAVAASREGTFKLLDEINKRLEHPLPDFRLTSSFERVWPRIEEALSDLPKSRGVPHLSSRFFIFNLKTKRCLEASGDKGDEGRSISLESFNGGERQRWLLYTRENENYRTIISQHTDNAMDVEGGAVNRSAKVHQWPFHGGSNQQWEFIAGDRGCFRLRRRKSRNHFLGIKDDLLWQVERGEGEDQLWWLQPVL